MAERRTSTEIGNRTSMRVSLDHDERQGERVAEEDEDEDEDFALAAMGISDGYTPEAMTSHSSEIHAQPQPHEQPQHDQPKAPPLRPSSISKPAYDFSLRHDGEMGALSSTSTGPSHSSGTSLSRTSSVSTDSGAYVSGNSSRGVESRVPPPRPSSTSKPAYDFALRHDGGMGVISPPNPSGPTMSRGHPLSRSSSVSTDSTGIARSESPYRGPSGPSHNYSDGMYIPGSQLSRTASVASTTTVPLPSRTSYSGPRGGPAHPYGLYPQGTVSGADTQDAIVTIPVGFPGHNNTNYQAVRRLGPDGEEIAGIIGPDGHSEELPPYTQYPDEVLARKTRPTVQTQAAAAVLPLSVPGAGGIGLATRNPEFASQESLFESPQSRQSNRSMSDMNSNHEVSPAAYQVSEKPQLKKWQIIARRKLCRVIPIWSLVLVGVSLLFFGVILGAVLAALKPKHKQMPKHHNDNNGGAPQTIVATMTTTFDATPFTVLPSNLQILPTGTYLLPITTPSVAPSSCIVDAAQSDAWSCSIAQSLPYHLEITGIPGEPDVTDNEIMLNLGNSSLDYLPYGAQPPVVEVAKVLRLVNDTEYPERGPAWFFQMPYNKVVVLPENALTDLAGTTAKRDLDLDQRHEPHTSSPPTVGAFTDGRKAVAQPNDKPWFCYWNGTLLEAFIYVNEVSKAGSPNYTRPAASATLTNSPSATSFTGSPTGFPGANPQFLPCYPKLLKIEERRIPWGDSIPPYCVQHIVHADGSWAPYLNATGLPVTVYLNETDGADVTTMGTKRNMLAEAQDYHAPLSKRQSNSQCGCSWLAQ